MSRIAPVTLPNGKVLYMEVDEDVTIDQPPASEGGDGYVPGLPGEPVGAVSRLRDAARDSVDTLTGVLEGIVTAIPAAFQHAVGADIEKITLSFGIKIAGEAGLPYLTKGTAEGNIVVTLECRYPSPVPQPPTSNG